MVTPSVERKRDVFWTLHESGCFVIPNPWDAGSAQLLGGMGFKALATTSSGHAWSNAKPDGHMQRDAVLDHIRHMVQATDLPLNADFESGYGKQPSDVFESVQVAVATGVAGLSIEDSSGNPREPVRDFLDAVERVRAAREGSMRAVPTRYWWLEPKTTLSVAPICQTRSSVCELTQKLARTACTRRGSKRAMRSPQWSGPWRPSPSTY